HGVLLSIAGGSDLGLFEVSAAAQLIEQAAHDEANIIFGTVIDDALGDEVRITVIAAGFDGGSPQQRPSVRPDMSRQQPRPATQAPQQQFQQGAPQQQRQQPPQANPMQSGRPEQPRPPAPRPADDDELDVPDFMK